ncbi:MAG: type II toxin-antitoxin system Phd/YefM family antitoxin [Caenispirillum bisanense]|nr:type II toxin-antitoxin system Phd/YefM family antitoxin [Caenispirillum bisanense]MCA1974909.1 type II toxin-antitoxin system Phd/YefM family antitoxin [Caenispirillum sp.]
MTRHASATDVQKQFGKWLEAAQREPVAIMRHGRESGYLISAEEYHQLRAASRQAYQIEDVPDDVWNRIATADYDGEAQ